MFVFFFSFKPVISEAACLFCIFLLVHENQVLIQMSYVSVWVKPFIYFPRSRWKLHALSEVHRSAIPSESKLFAISPRPAHFRVSAPDSCAGSCLTAHQFHGAVNLRSNDEMTENEGRPALRLCARSLKEGEDELVLSWVASWLCVRSAVPARVSPHG